MKRIDWCYYTYLCLTLNLFNIGLLFQLIYLKSFKANSISLNLQSCYDLYNSPSTSNGQSSEVQPPKLQVCSQKPQNISICGATYLPVGFGTNLHQLIRDGGAVISFHNESESLADSNSATTKLNIVQPKQRGFFWPQCGLGTQPADSSYRTRYCHPDKCILLLSFNVEKTTNGDIHKPECCCKASGCNHRVYILNREIVNDNNSLSYEWINNDAKRLGVSSMLYQAVLH